MIKKIEIELLRKGMYVHGLSRSSGESYVPDFMHIITSDEEIEQYVRDGFQYVYVHSDEEAKPDSLVAPDPVEFDEEIERAVEIKAEAASVVEDFMKDARAGKAVESARAKEVVSSMVESVLNNRDALLSLSRLKDHDNYTFGHSVNVCILAIALGRQMGLNREGLQDLGLGAILHDIGKMKVPERILNKQSTLTDAEYSEIKKHIGYANEILSLSHDINNESKKAVLQHHEWYDGSGYPGKLSGDEIHSYARMICLSDFYDAMTTKRIYRDILVPSEVLRRIFVLEENKFDPDIADRLIKCLGIYPIGSLVELDTGEVAVVKRTNRINSLIPVVVIILDSEKRMRPIPKEVDLAEDTGRSIVNVLDPSRFSVNVDQFI